MEYTIMEYNTDTRKYEKLGFSHGSTSSEAKANFAKDTSWKPRKNTLLFARGPICR